MTKALKLQELFDLAAENAARIFNENEEHEVLPMWHAVYGNGDNVLIATPWSDDEEKEKTIEALRAMFRQHQVKRYAFVVEAWTAQAIPVPQGQTAGEAYRNYNGPRPSEHPDRREVLMITAEDRDGSQIMGFFYILRPEIGPPKLSPLEVQPFDGTAGRMVGLLT